MWGLSVLSCCASGATHQLEICAGVPSQTAQYPRPHILRAYPYKSLKALTAESLRKKALALGWVTGSWLTFADDPPVL